MCSFRSRCRSYPSAVDKTLQPALLAVLADDPLHISVGMQLEAAERGQAGVWNRSDRHAPSVAEGLTQRSDGRGAPVLWGQFGQVGGDPLHHTQGAAGEVGVSKQPWFADRGHRGSSYQRDQDRVPIARRPRRRARGRRHRRVAPPSRRLRARASARPTRGRAVSRAARHRPARRRGRATSPQTVANSGCAAADTRPRCPRSALPPHEHRVIECPGRSRPATLWSTESEALCESTPARRTESGLPTPRAVAGSPRSPRGSASPRSTPGSGRGCRLRHRRCRWIRRRCCVARRG